MRSGGDGLAVRSAAACRMMSTSAARTSCGGQRRAGGAGGASAPARSARRITRKKPSEARFAPAPRCVAVRCVLARACRGRGAPPRSCPALRRGRRGRPGRRRPQCRSQGRPGRRSAAPSWPEAPRRPRPRQSRPWRRTAEAKWLRHPAGGHSARPPLRYRAQALLVGRAKRETGADDAECADGCATLAAEAAPQRLRTARAAHSAAQHAPLAAPRA